MRKTRLFLNLALTALILFSCSVDGQGSESVFSTASSAEVSLSSLASEESSSSASPSASSSSRRKTSSSSAKSSSDNKTYFTVSIYQSYYIDETMTLGNPRYDTSVKVEAGKPLFETSDEARALRSKCHEVYTPSGGTWFIDGFFIDETCTQYITSYMLVESDMNAYYYCHG